MDLSCSLSLPALDSGWPFGNELPYYRYYPNQVPLPLPYGTGNRFYRVKKNTPWNISDCLKSILKQNELFIETNDKIMETCSIRIGQGKVFGISNLQI